MDSKQKPTRRHRFRSRRQQKEDQQNRKDTRNPRPSPNGGNYSDIVKANPSFEKFYRLQQIVRSEDEWTEFMETLTRPLPSDFRISSYCVAQAERMRDLIRNSLDNCGYTPQQAENGESKTENNGDSATPAVKLPPADLAVTPIPWYPNEQAWTINMSKVEIRKTPVLRKLHKFLISETETGDISRQEAVSMIPPLLLDVHPGHSVLDMCAAPGSKTAQIIEMLHQGSSHDFIVDANGATLRSTEQQLPINGLVVANDVDNKRCYMLIHQSNRLHSPTVVITNHDASLMPTFYKTDKNNIKSPLKFDRVLADVPCTGDGTVRKNYDVWTKWSPGNSNNFHFLQQKIARRGLELLAKDGLMAYSTCSLHPAEDEAVIASLLNAARGGLELVDAAQLLPELKCRPGLETWSVMSREDELFTDFSQVPESYHTHIRESLFPPKNVAELKLTRCIRVLPHYQNTGGFFIAILRKKVDKLAWEGEGESKAVVAEEQEKPAEAAESEESKNGGQRKKKKGMYFGHREDPFFFLNETDQDWPVLKSYYKFPDSFPCQQLAHRCSKGKRRNIYFLTELSANFIASNPHVKVITGGSRVFNRVDVQSVKCPMRITQEGIPTLFPFFVSQLATYRPDLAADTESSTFNIVELDRAHFVRLLQQEDIKMDQFDPALLPMMSKLSTGCVILYILLDRPGSAESKFIVPICAWKGKNSVRAYVARNDRVHILRLCGEDPEEMDIVVQQDKNKGTNKQTEDDEVGEEEDQEESENSSEPLNTKKAKLDGSIEV